MLTEVGSVDVADWWPAMSSRFDQEAPELERHLVVHVGERQAVTALRFLTDRSPYVITSGGEDGALHREVPIRDGARTRSARRDELLRLLIPAVAPPAAQLLSAKFYIVYEPVQGKGGDTLLEFSAEVFFQQPTTPAGVVMLPAHQMYGRIVRTWDSRFFQWKLQYRDPLTSSAFSGGMLPRPGIPPTSAVHGLTGRPDGVVITGPGTLTVVGETRLDGDHRSLFEGPAGLQLHLSFGVAGIDRRIRIDAELDVVPHEAGSARIEWQLNVPSDDPWATTEEQ
jgi:hypothetical protein